MKPKIQIHSYTGQDVRDFIPQIAALRIEVFAEYPFLYIGDYDYEMRYLKKFLNMEDAISLAAFNEKTLIGVSTGYPFIYEAENLQNLFLSSGLHPDDYFCFGESVLRKSYRGLGIGGKFLEMREKYVRNLKKPYKYLCFYTSDRSLDDPKRPLGYRSLAPFWEKRGFVKHPELIGTISYQEIGEKEETPKNMVFWIKTL